MLEEKLRVKAPAYHAHQAAAVVADPDGLVRAMVGGRDYGASQFNRATDALRQPGSSFKVFVYLTALLTGKFHANTPVDASGICIGDYCVHNYDGESGGRCRCRRRWRSPTTPPRSGCRSRSARPIGRPASPITWRKIAALGRSKIVETARTLGLTTPLADTVSLPIGADEVKMIDMVGANATLANGGKRATPTRRWKSAISRRASIYTYERDGPPPEQIVPADKVAEMNNIMTHVVTEGTGRGAQIPGLVISGKTGTTNNSTNAWFNAFTGNLVGSVWFGNDDNSPMGDMTGGTLPALSWQRDHGLRAPRSGAEAALRRRRAGAAPGSRRGGGQGRRRHRRAPRRSRCRRGRRASSLETATRARPEHAAESAGRRADAAAAAPAAPAPPASTRLTSRQLAIRADGP